eukprot:XP_016664965.1 PREDICTED: influenza virus NS1A-binding protein homolog isoform X1 [Acyrthosiphon pisum]
MTRSCDSDLKQVLTSKECEPTNFRNNFHPIRILEDLQSLRKYVSPYFRAMFTNFDESYEYYDPSVDTWTSVAPMSARHHGIGVGVLDGVMYAIGGYDGKYLKNFKDYRPSDGV